MPWPVRCCIVGMPDGRFGVLAVVGSGRVFGPARLLVPAEANAPVDAPRDVMTACGAPGVLSGGNGYPLLSEGTPGSDVPLRVRGSGSAFRYQRREA